MFAGRCHHQDWISGKYITQPNRWGWGRGLGAGQGAGDRGHRFSPLPAPCGEGTETPPSPKKGGDGLKDAHGQSCKGLLLPRGAAPGGGRISGQQI